MEAFYIYLIKSSGLIALFYLAYHFMLRKETFFTSNRWFLLLGLFTSVLLPLVIFTKIIWVEPTPVNYDWSSLPITTTVNEDHTEEYIYLGLAVLYCMGALFLLTKFGFDFYSLQKVFKGKIIKRQADFKFIDLQDNLAPFSFFYTIVYNSSLYSSSELENILEHEKVHSEQNHTVDVLISRLFCILFWFNPFIWLYKKAILQNLEFIADSEATKKISDKKAYQFTLLKITTHENCVAITNHFYQSLIKKRIVMLNKNQSKKSNSWKYAIVLPALVAYIFFFQMKVIAQEKNEPLITNIGLKFELHVTSTSTEKELNAEKVFFKEQYNLEMKFSGIKTNKNDEIIAIKVQLKNKEGEKIVKYISEETPIKPFSIYAEKDGTNKLNFGFRNAVNQDSKKHFEFIKAPKETQKDIIAIKKDIGFWSVDNFNKNGTNYLIVINGVQQKENTPIKIPIEEDISSEIVLDPEAAIQKYGAEGKNGAIEITTKNLKREMKNPIIFINGKKTNTTMNDLNKTDQNLIESMTVLKSIIALGKYGKDGENGVIEIITKENVDLLKSSNEKSN
jgi:hypothetical protein